MISAVEAKVTINIDGDLFYHNSFIKYDDGVYIRLDDLPRIAEHWGSNLDLTKLFDFSRYSGGEILFFELENYNQVIPYLNIKRIAITCLRCNGFHQAYGIAESFFWSNYKTAFEKYGKPVKHVYLN
ncbi:Uncharacterised protein [Anaerobiospirillum thomasii]|uniref:hypothetical protein n=1 Tax=Anaerobiospirillum thomasii TaxID=179995 RepID=UPI000D94071D|nr:hypothetical protein [Anaerobiospirillum thomasii]SPT71541.1 Uncharacterised protein [Anaerobiospirillum thomasii]